MSSNQKPCLIVLSGAGISAESGIATFRGSDGLWEGHRVTDVASPEGWNRDPQLVLDFYNQRRSQIAEASPNQGHQVLVELEEHFDVRIITQNIDDLHERAGSSQVLHLHGEIFKARGSHDPNSIQEWGNREIQLGDRGRDGSQLRPHIVWFGESVPKMEPALEWAEEAEALIIVGTSLVVYPAAGLVQYVPTNIPKFLVDPNSPTDLLLENLTIIQEEASTGLAKAKSALLELAF